MSPRGAINSWTCKTCGDHLVAMALLAWQWAKASRTQLKRWRRENPAMYNHCVLGGLVLGPLTDAGRSALDMGKAS